MPHRIYGKSTRLPDWDYTSASWYFVTICTLDRRPMLGRVVDGEMRLSSAGRVVIEEWLRAQQVRANVSLDEYVVMPNHVHGIIVLNDPPGATQPAAPHRGASTLPPLPRNSLGSIIGQFKSNSTKRIWASGFREYSWQPRFHDHIIRSEASLDAIRKYIVENPAKWAFDKDNREGLRM